MRETTKGTEMTKPMSDKERAAMERVLGRRADYQRRIDEHSANHRAFMDALEAAEEQARRDAEDIGWN